MFKFPDPKLKSQMVVMLAIGFVIVILGASSIFSSQKSLDLAKKVDVATSQFSEIITTQDDLSLFEFRLVQWMHGDVPRQDVQAANSILIRQLNATSATGITLAQRAIPGFLTGLRNADDMLAGAPEGYLPDLMQNQYLNQGYQILITTESAGSRLIADYRNVVTEQIHNYTVVQRTAVLRNLYLQLASRVVAIAFIAWLFVRSRRRHQRRKIELKRTQQRLQEVRTNLGTAHEVVESLRQENMEKTQIVSTINHELRTPLTSIIGYIDMLKGFSVTTNEKEFQKVLSVMDRNASVLVELVESILSLSALNSRETLADTSNIDLVDTCEKCVAGLHLQIESANIHVNINFDPAENYTVRGNKSLLSQVFTNLISNAVKFSPKNSRVDITFSRTTSESLGNIVQVQVQDHGIGIPKDEIDRLFSSFFRASNASSNNIPGSGLGLAIVKRIGGLHGGEISVKSTVGEGTTMIVDLPLEISPLESLVMDQRQEVLERAIESLVKSPAEKLAETAHDVGGTIGFYTYLIESNVVLDLSRWLEKNPNADTETVLTKKEAVLQTLNAALIRVKEWVD